MKWLDLTGLIEYKEDSPNRILAFENEQAKAVLLCFKSGQRVKPCVMDRDVLFFVVKGTGFIMENGETRVLQPCVLVMVPKGVERVIQALEDLVLLGFQIG